ncbi:MAG: hypothetical protein VB081_04150 [Christensenella sp.]|uniref:hypothetical protein n=1 Tax=Christensenella sp. TaxID=1935934 RepID=UPI002B1F65DD|nr:hypothetical protein [Christensenella sp.]MEA5002671.1 hypothetical protein [Christensenella sp.]
MNGKQNGFGIGIGGISILAVFVVLCLTTLATLSFTTAQADLRLAEKTAQAQQQYYAADTQAERMLAEILTDIKGNSGYEDELVKKGYTLTRRTDGAAVEYTVDAGQSKELCVRIGIALDANGMPTGEWTRESWQTRMKYDTSGEDDTLHVLK